MQKQTALFYSKQTGEQRQSCKKKQGKTDLFENIFLVSFEVLVSISWCLVYQLRQSVLYAGEDREEANREETKEMVPVPLLQFWFSFNESQRKNTNWRSEEKGLFVVSNSSSLFMRNFKIAEIYKLVLLLLLLIIDDDHLPQAMHQEVREKVIILLSNLSSMNEQTDEPNQTISKTGQDEGNWSWDDNCF